MSAEIILEKHLQSMLGRLAHSYTSIEEMKKTPEWETTIEAMKEYAKQAIDEREVVIKAFDDIRKEFEGRKWLMDGRGAYPYNDDRYKEEVRYIMNAFDGITFNVWKNIKSKTYEYRDFVEKPILEKISELEKEIELLKKEK